ncbi:hypothetical protein AAKU67_001904, partial [Oxalobacteraceae bacterium GrIS 2.11]
SRFPLVHSAPENIDRVSVLQHKPVQVFIRTPYSVGANSHDRILDVAKRLGAKVMR